MNRPPFMNPMNTPNTSKNEVNWAQLAQRWIAERDNGGQDEYSMPSAAVAPMSGNHYRGSPGMTAQSSSAHHQQYGSFFLPPPTTNRPQRPPPGFIPPPLQASPVPYANYGNPYASHSNATGNGAPQRPLFQSHAHEAATVPGSYNQPAGPDFNQQWPNSGPAWADPATMQWMSMGDWSAYDANAVIDQQMRTKLPAWILEGLEQAEKEKQKKAEKEFAAKKAADNEKERERRRKEKGLGKFDTDSEEEEEEDKPTTRKASSSSSVSNLDTKPAFAPQSRIGHKRKSSRDIEDFRENEMTAIKRLVTDVLLEASEKALIDQVQRFLKKIRTQAKPKLIAKSSGLAALAGIVGYSDDEDSE